MRLAVRLAVKATRSELGTHHRRVSRQHWGRDGYVCAGCGTRRLLQRPRLLRLLREAAKLQATAPLEALRTTAQRRRGRLVLGCAGVAGLRVMSEGALGQAQAPNHAIHSGIHYHCKAAMRTTQLIIHPWRQKSSLYYNQYSSGHSHTAAISSYKKHACCHREIADRRPTPNSNAWVILLRKQNHAPSAPGA